MPKYKIDYDPVIAEKICDLVASNTLGLKHILAKDETLPKKSTVYKWLKNVPEFAEMFARAKEAQMDLMAEELLEIADDGSNDLMTIVKGDESYEVENKEVTNRSRLRVDTRKWIMSKLAPRKYGDKLDITSGGKTLARPPWMTNQTAKEEEDKDENENEESLG